MNHERYYLLTVAAGFLGSNISELARVCDISRTTAYKYKALLEG